MPRRWRWLVPIAALIACMYPRAGASAAPHVKADFEPSSLVERRAAQHAQVATLWALTKRKEEHAREQAREAARVVRTAVGQIGDGYAYGGTGPGAFDCSGLTAFAFAEAGVELPHSSYGQFTVGTAVDRREIRRGDLVFFSTAGSGASHVGVATGASTVVSATNSGVMEHPIKDAYWGGHYVGARRLL
jgi:cell wall-associated NlpC family hydrolase